MTRKKIFALWFVGLLVIAALLALPTVGPRLVPSPEPGGLVFLGRFHLLILHLPIGALVCAAVLEIVNFFRRRPLETTWVLGFALVAALPTVILGYLLARDIGFSALLIKHMWTALAGVSLLVLAFLLKLRAPRPVYLLMLFLSLGVISVSAHFGGSAVEGPDFLFQYAPPWLQKLAGYQPPQVKGFPVQGHNSPSPGLPPDAVYTQIITPILTQNCTGCHSATTSKGGLDLANLAAILKGGRAGAVIVPGQPDQSLLIHRITLPEDDDDHMPPNGQLSPDEITILRLWIKHLAPTPPSPSPTPGAK